jgi:hypothetical protein
MYGRLARSVAQYMTWTSPLRYGGSLYSHLAKGKVLQQTNTQPGCPRRTPPVKELKRKISGVLESAPCQKRTRAAWRPVKLCSECLAALRRFSQVKAERS